MPDPNQNVSPQQSDLPPLPLSAQAAQTEVTPPVSPIINSTPKKKSGRGRIFATILGILILFGGISAGYLLTQQKQLFQQQARECVDRDCAITSRTSGGSTTYTYERSRDQNANDTQQIKSELGLSNTNTSVVVDNTTDNGGGQGASCTQNAAIDSGCANGYSCVGGTCQGNPTTDTCGRNSDPGAPVCCTGSCVGEAVCEKPGRRECKSASGVYCTIETNSSSCSGANTTTNTNESTPTPPISPTPTATPTPAPGTAMCISVKAYSTSGNTGTPLTDAQLSALRPGNIINFCVLGSETPSGGATPTAFPGSFDSAQFSINGVVKPIIDISHLTITAKGVCQSYTILSTDTSVNVKAKIHHSTLGWVGETF